MTGASDGPTPATEPNDEGWAERLKVCAFLTLYVTGLWGQAGRLLPAPFNDWHGIPYRLLASWWHEHVLPQISHAEQLALYQIAEGYLLALVVPLLALRWLGISAADAGLGMPRALGLRTTVAGIVLTLPVGLWLAMATPAPWGTPLYEALELLTLPPEHFLVFGIFGVMLLPGRRLIWSPTSQGAAGAGLFTLCAASTLFLLIHVGTPQPLALLASLPLGLVFAAMTFATGSIWPAVLAHLSLNLVPMAFLAPAG